MQSQNRCTRRLQRTLFEVEHLAGRVVLVEGVLVERVQRTQLHRQAETDTWSEPASNQAASRQAITLWRPASTTTGTEWCFAATAQHTGGAPHKPRISTPVVTMDETACTHQRCCGRPSPLSSRRSPSLNTSKEHTARLNNQAGEHETSSRCTKK